MLRMLQAGSRGEAGLMGVSWDLDESGFVFVCQTLRAPDGVRVREAGLTDLGRAHKFPEIPERWRGIPGKG